MKRRLHKKYVFHLESEENMDELLNQLQLYIKAHKEPPYGRPATKSRISRQKDLEQELPKRKN